MRHELPSYFSYVVGIYNQLSYFSMQYYKWNLPMFMPEYNNEICILESSWAGKLVNEQFVSGINEFCRSVNLNWIVQWISCVSTQLLYQYGFMLAVGYILYLNLERKLRSEECMMYFMFIIHKLYINSKQSPRLDITVSYLVFQVVRIKKLYEELSWILF